MVVIYHKNNLVVEVKNNQDSIAFKNVTITEALFTLAEKYPDELILWCELSLKDNLNYEALPVIFHHKKILASFNLISSNFLPDAIGYVEQSPYIKINKKVRYPTWIMSSKTGGVHASVLSALKNQITLDNDFDYFLCSMAKLGMDQGLLCYSEPLLIKDFLEKENKLKDNWDVLFKFVKQHYRTRWVFLLFLNLLVYERKTLFFPLLKSFVYRKRNLRSNSLENIKVESINKVVEKNTIDVIIPTIGRKKYLYDVLKDLSRQVHLPENVIIVEQNPDKNSVSELDYIKNENWPFKIKHIFTNQTGVCNARNTALSLIESEWVFLNDDDNRFDENLLKDVLANLKSYGIKSLSTSYLQPKEIKENKIISQAQIFGSGNSFIHASLLDTVKFDMRFEFGYGEDSDFGMQIRNSGVDVIYFPNLEILHLKAPIGGFRVKPILAWDNDEIQPKPSPTIMLNMQLHLSQQQIKCYKTILFFKFYKVQKIKNPIIYLKNFEKQWKQSIYWSDKLKLKKA
ncbi:glycosyltransferase family 2 protein [Flavobacterium hungaricum]|uniref:Glycosyltransferase family 2 protein n=1 Tax=Flavobacterium hungaricum TaxID=2082725 RepID=A0ABR9TT14_9FLAO|nr:glycosyltransferase family A protein [Flavobacterium hungaricum]MBE8727792.1 glycosyltransferase family 2 protein [Flavobacterium hungaricum]